MRKELENKAGERKKFRAVFVRFGKKTNYHGYSEETVLLKHVIDVETDQLVADHLWFSYTKTFQRARLIENTRITFHARVKKYAKGYVNRRFKIDRRTSDFKLSHATQVEVVPSE